MKSLLVGLFIFTCFNSNASAACILSHIGAQDEAYPLHTQIRIAKTTVFTSHGWSEWELDHGHGPLLKLKNSAGAEVRLKAGTWVRLIKVNRGRKLVGPGNEYVFATPSKNRFSLIESRRYQSLGHEGMNTNGFLNVLKDHGIIDQVCYPDEGL